MNQPFSLPLFDELTLRGMIDQITHPELKNLLNTGSLRFYVGFDPTADSFHVGQLAVFNLMRFLQAAGHRPILLMGVGTGMIGDPSGKSSERILMSLEKIEKNIGNIQKQMLKLLPPIDDNVPLLANNHDWLGQKLYLEFLRDIGKHFSVNQMIARDSVSSRLNREGEGITYTEFSYMLLQAYDFYELNHQYDCTLQLGGSDQWGNIVSGVDLTRRLAKKQVYGLTTPLLTKADGSKFGKSEGGTIWLDAQKTSPYHLYQYFYNQSDSDVIKLLKVLTPVPLRDINQLAELTQSSPHLRLAQKRLAAEVVQALHGDGALADCVKASQALFGKPLDELSATMIETVFSEVPALGVPATSAARGLDPVEWLLRLKATSSKGEARKLIQAGGFYINNIVYDKLELIPLQLWLHQKYLVIRSGKKNYYLLKITV